MSKGDGLIWSGFRNVVSQTLAVFTSLPNLSILLTGWLVVVVAGPFGTFQTMGMGLRLVYWGFVIVTGVIIAAACRAVVLPLCLGWRPLIVDAAMSLGTATLLAPLICTLRASLDPVLTHDELAVGVIWVHTMFVVAPIFLLRRQFGLEKGLSAPAPERPRLARRLPEALQGADILRLSGNGHTVEVVTDQGAHTLRLRLSDAIDEMEPVAGMCTHRSHWVTLAAMTGRECREGKVFLRLSNGERVPVSRTYAPQLEAAGVIPPRPVSED